jgi:hypothetical protein
VGVWGRSDSPTEPEVFEAPNDVAGGGFHIFGAMSRVAVFTSFVTDPRTSKPSAGARGADEIAALFRVNRKKVSKPFE